MSETSRQEEQKTGGLSFIHVNAASRHRMDMPEPSEITALLDRELAVRDSIFPDRDPNNDQRLESLLAAYVEHASNLNADALPREASYLDEKRAEVLSGNCLFLCGYMKSGTTLLLELLDGHPEIVALPGDSWFIGSMDRLAAASDVRHYYRSEFERWLTRLVNPTGQDPFWLLGKDIGNYSRFLDRCDYWARFFREEKARHLLSIVMSYADVNPRIPDYPALWVEKTPGNEFQVDRILHYFPQAKFLHIVRDPRENMASVKKLYVSRNWDWNAGGTARKIAESCRLAEKYSRNLGKDRYRFLRYEDLTANPAEVMGEVGDFLKTRWNESFLRPTVNGMTAQSNTMYTDRQVRGAIRPISGSRWEHVLDPHERVLIRATQRDAARMGYRWKRGLLEVPLTWGVRICKKTAEFFNRR